MDNPYPSLLKNPKSPISSTAAQNALSLFSDYIKTLQMKDLNQDIASSVGGKIAHESFLALFDFSNIYTRPIYYSLKFGFSWMGKKIVCAFSPTQQPDINITNLTEEGFVWVEAPEESGFTDTIYTLSDECKNYVFTLKPIDLMHMAGGTIGASVAGLTFALCIGAPGLVGMPVLLLTEVMAKGFGAYLAEIGTKKILGNRSDLPFISQALQHIPKSILLDESYEEQASQKILENKLLLKQIAQEQNIKKQIAEFELIENSEKKITPVYPYSPYYGFTLASGIKPNLTEYIQNDYLPKTNLSPNKS